MTIALATNGLIAPLNITLNLAANITGELANIDNCDSEQGQLTILHGNSVNLDFLITSNGVKLTKEQLEAAESITFAVKNDPQDTNEDAVILKEVGDGITILPNGDSTSANVRVALLGTDTDIDENSYSVGLQINFSETDIKEAALTVDNICFDEIFIAQDVVR
jgi:hypothetical protein